MMKVALCCILMTGIAFVSVGDVLPDSTNVHRLDEVVVTGSNEAISRNLLPYTVTTVNGDRLEASPTTQLLSSISGIVPSLFVSERNILGFGISNGGSGGIKIRGVGGAPTNAVLMMVDGQPQFAGIYSHHVADFYGTDYVERVEVLCGPGSVLYGSNAMGGVINVITKRAKTPGVKTLLTSQYGSFNTWQTSLTNTVRSGHFSSLVSLGYDRTDGTIDNFDFKRGNVYAKASYEINNHWSVSADYTFMQFIGNDPVYAKLTDPSSEDIYHQNVIRGETSMSAYNNYASSYGVVRAYYSYGNHFVDDPRHFHSVDDRVGIIAYQNFRPWSGLYATVGFDFDRYTGKIPMSGGNQHTDGSLSTMERKAIAEYSPYITLAQGMFDDILMLNGGLRMANSNRFSTKWLPQVGFAIAPANGWTFKASLSKGYRNPSFRELYLYRTANPDLKPEDMINYEASISYHLNRYLNIGFTAYFSEGSNMIQTVDMKNVNTGSFINKGLELSLQSHPVDGLQAWLTYSYLHTSLHDLTCAPKNQYYIGVGWDFLPKFHVDAQMKGVGGLYVSDDIDNQNYVTVDVKLSYAPLKYLNLFLNIENITDAQYVITRGYDMPGLSAFGGFKLKI